MRRIERLSKKNLTLLIFGFVLIILAARVEALLPFNIFKFSIVLTLPLMVALTLIIPDLGVLVSALAMFVGGGLFSGFDVLTSLLVGLGAIHAIVLPQMGYRYVAPRLGIRLINGFQGTGRQKIFFLFFGCLLPAVVFTLFVMGMIKKRGYISPLELKQLWPIVAAAAFAATAAITPVFLMAKKG